MLGKLLTPESWKHTRSTAAAADELVFPNPRNGSDEVSVRDLVSGLGLGVHRNSAALEESFGRQDGSAVVAGAGAARAKAAVTPPAGAAVDVRWAEIIWSTGLFGCRPRFATPKVRCLPNCGLPQSVVKLDCLVHSQSLANLCGCCLDSSHKYLIKTTVLLN